MELTSQAFADGGQIPVIYTRPGVGGQNISPPLAWSGIPNGAKGLALTVVDPHPVARDWLHWLVVDLPPQAGGVAQGASLTAMPVGAREFYNAFGEQGYGGPQPPSGTGAHPYVFTLYALDTLLDGLTSHTSLDRFHQAIKGHVLAETTLTGYFGR